VVKQRVFAWTSKVWDIHTQTLVVGYRWKIKNLGMLYILAKQLSPIHNMWILTMHILSYFWKQINFTIQASTLLQIWILEKKLESRKMPTHPATLALQWRTVWGIWPLKRGSSSVDIFFVKVEFLSPLQCHLHKFC
jgi:hypothetical protein